MQPRSQAGLVGRIRRWITGAPPNGDSKGVLRPEKPFANEKSRRAQLIEARESLQREIAELNSHVPGDDGYLGLIPDSTRDLIARLSGMLAEIEAELNDE